MSEANKRQVAGDHYSGELQHWDIVVARDWDYFQAQITRYLDRWKKKNGIEDLRKAQHYLDKYIELAEQDDKKLHVGIGCSVPKTEPPNKECNCRMCKHERNEAEDVDECKHTSYCTCKECCDQAKRDG